METIVGILIVAGIYFFYTKGKEFFSKQKGSFIGGNRLNQWGYLKYIHPILPKEPDEIIFKYDIMKLVFNYTPYIVFINVKIGDSSKVYDDLIITAILDQRLESVSQSKNVDGEIKFPNLSVSIVSSELNPREISESFQETIKNYIINYRDIAAKDLSESYKRTGIVP